jgi:hypothetical protein
MMVTKKMWGGFSNGRLHRREVDDYWGGVNRRQAHAIFTSYAEAKKQYHDVRRIEVRYYEKHKSR